MLASCKQAVIFNYCKQSFKQLLVLPPIHPSDFFCRNKTAFAIYVYLYLYHLSIYLSIYLAVPLFFLLSTFQPKNLLNRWEKGTKVRYTSQEIDPQTQDSNLKLHSCVMLFVISCMHITVHYFLNTVKMQNWLSFSSLPAKMCCDE